MFKFVHSLKHFFDKTIWSVDFKALSWHKKLLIYSCRVLVIIVTEFSKHKLPVRSTALAYTTLLSIVPLLAVSLSIFKAFGGLEKAAGPIQDFLLSNLATGNGNTAVVYFQQFIESYQSAQIGLVGFILLIFTVIALLTSIEKAFNDIWMVQKQRPFIQRVTVYWSMITIGPILLALSLSITSALQSHTLVNNILGLTGAQQFFIAKLPWVTTFALFTSLYMIMPNTKVRFRSAIIGGVIGGALWEVAKIGYTIYAAQAVVYSKIYGALGIIPIFLIWIYYTWVVVLIGAQIAFADQHFKEFKRSKGSER